MGHINPSSSSTKPLPRLGFKSSVSSSCRTIKRRPLFHPKIIRLGSSLSLSTSRNGKFKSFILFSSWFPLLVPLEISRSRKAVNFSFVFLFWLFLGHGGCCEPKGVSFGRRAADDYHLGSHTASCQLQAAQEGC